MSVSWQKKLVLASGSPRRRQLVSALVPVVELIASPSEEEKRREGETPEEFVVRASLSKARAVARRVRQGIVLGADTVVVLDGEVLGKPGDATDAVRMLRLLRGRPHRVVTGLVALDDALERWVATAKSTGVTMRRYTNAEVEAYVASGDPLDKAGAYAIQDDVFHPAERVEGCYLNIVGLPLCEVMTLVARAGGMARLRPDWVVPEGCRDCPLKPRDEELRS